MGLPSTTELTLEWYPWTVAFLLLLCPLFLLTSHKVISQIGQIVGWTVVLMLYAFYSLWLVIVGVGLYLPTYKLEQLG